MIQYTNDNFINTSFFSVMIRAAFLGLSIECFGQPSSSSIATVFATVTTVYEQSSPILYTAHGPSKRF